MFGTTSMMERHASKRRKLEYGDDHAPGDYDFQQDDNKERSPMPAPKLVLPAHHPFGVHGAAREKVQHIHQSQQSKQSTPRKIQVRELVGTHVKNVAPPAPETTSTVMAIAIDNGQGTVSRMEVPVASKSVWISGYGMLILANNGATPTITASAEGTPSNPNSNPGSVVPPAAIAASQARDQARQTQEAIAKQLNVVPQAPANSAQPTSQAVAVPSVASQSPLAVNSPESRSQQVLSSPPTPLPATPPPSASTSASYFSSSPAAITGASTSLTPSPSIPQSSIPFNPQLSASTNSSTTGK